MRKIDEETFQRLDDSYEHVFAMLSSMEKKADTFCRPSFYRSGLQSSISCLGELCVSVVKKIEIWI